MQPSLPIANLTEGGLGSMPANGFGTCCRRSANGPALTASALIYLREGGRHLDTAQLYQNGAALREAIEQSLVPREQIWITSKVNTLSIRSRRATVKAVRAAVSELGVRYVDLMLIHGSWRLRSRDKVAVWRGLLDSQAAGLTRSVGVANFVRDEIELLENATHVLPAVHQLEWNPWSSDATRQLVRWCQSRRIAVTAYNSLGGSAFDVRSLRGVSQVARRHNVSNAQVLLSWALAGGVAVIPGATSHRHIADNLHLRPIELSHGDVRLIRADEAHRTTLSFKVWNSRSDQDGRRANGSRGGSTATAKTALALLVPGALCTLVLFRFVLK